MPIVKYKTASHTLPSGITTKEIQEWAASMLGVPLACQKLVLKGRQLTNADEVIDDKAKVMLLGSSYDEEGAERALREAEGKVAKYLADAQAAGMASEPIIKDCNAMLVSLYNHNIPLENPNYKRRELVTQKLRRLVGSVG
eukprot:TRINITY_DN31611_c0_g1_i1.p1 TRINITY_DN31611_c0_g1~~TRINITY_DN31611_c0_g1_i1.p1  ORF type:complete len:141 (+),score=34.29 TRINITY_DN31611_c0_g1_i1:46-468(+)